MSHDPTAWDCEMPFDGMTYRDRSCPICGPERRTGTLTEVPFADVMAEVRRIRQTPCPRCGGTHHTPVDIDGPSGEYRRHCHDCGLAFRVAEIIR